MTKLMAGTASLENFHGAVLRPDEPAYDQARAVFNGMIDRRPAVILRCTTANDVAAAVRYAVGAELPLTVYGGGHSVTGSAVADGAVCVDLRGLQDVSIDPAARVARAGGGLTWGELDAATQEHGLAVTGGRVSSTGVGGLALGSGSGWLERSLGFTCDNLLSAEVVTAAGRKVTASPEQHPDLFWALRGGGGNFGVVTEFTLRLHPVGPLVYGGMLMYPAVAAAEVIRTWRSFIATAPDALGMALAFITAPPADFVPEPVRGQPVLGAVVCWSGPVEEGVDVLAPLLAAAPPAVAMVQPMPYTAVQQLLDPASPHGMQNYWSGDFFQTLPDEAIDVLVGLATQPASPLTQVIVVPGGGALGRVDADATAFGDRGAQFNLHYLGMWPDPADSEINIASIQALRTAMKPWATGQVYLNFLGDEGQARIEDGFGPQKYARLREIKKAWDPTNVFCHNQNIPPAP